MSENNAPEPNDIPSEYTPQKPDGALKQTIDSATALMKAVPIYQDAMQPVAQEAGKALGTLGKTVNVALAPLAVLVWGYDKIKDYLENRLEEKLEKVPEEEIQTPNPSVAGPAIEALRFTGHDEDLRELFANLIATAMDKNTAIEAHPAFVDILKNLSPDEAKILRFLALRSDVVTVDIKLNHKGGGYSVLHRHVTTLATDAGCEHPQRTTHYTDNLVRLGLIEIPYNRRKSGEDPYQRILNDPLVQQLKDKYDKIDGVSISFNYMFFSVTDLGKQFIQACVIDKALR